MSSRSPESLECDGIGYGYGPLHRETEETLWDGYTIYDLTFPTKKSDRPSMDKARKWECVESKRFEGIKTSRNSTLCEFASNGMFNAVSACIQRT